MSAEFNLNNPLAASSAQPSPEADSDDLMWELLSLYVDGEASPAESAQVEQMLRHDAEYNRAYEFMQQTSCVVHTIAEVEPPAFLRDAILAKTSHRLTFGQRLSAGFASFRAQLALPPMGRLALAGGSLAACALLIGVWTARPADNGMSAPVVASNTAPPANSNFNMPAQSAGVNLPQKGGPGPQNAVAGVNSTPKTIPSTRSMKPAITVDTGGLRSEPRIAPPLLTAVADKTPTVKAISQVTHGPVFKVKSDMRKVADNTKKPYTPAPPSTGPDGAVHDAVADTQNVSPMMDVSVQHRQVAMVDKPMRPDDDLDRDVVTNIGDGGNAAQPAVASNDMDSAPKGRLVGKLQLSKLPPTARHLQTAADIQRIQEARNMSYAATVMDGVQRRDSDLSVLSGKF